MLAAKRPQASPDVQARASALPETDEGLRAHMLRIYGYMTAGLAVTGAVAWATASLAVAEGPGGPALTPFGQMVHTAPLSWIVMLAPLGLVILMSLGMSRMRASAMQGAFWILSACYGVSLSSILLVHTGESVVRAFFVASSMFLAMSLYGHTTRRSLVGFGPVLLMGLVGLVVAGIANILLASSGLQFALSAIGVLVFAGLTAYDTQRLKEGYVAGLDGEAAARQAVSGALSLYLDFLLLFVHLLQLLGSRD